MPLALVISIRATPHCSRVDMTGPHNSCRLKPRKPPKQRRAAQTVKAVLESARELLESEGLNGYNTNAIAARARLSVGTVYQYFGSKDEITKALIASEDESLIAALVCPASVGSPRAALNLMIGALVDHQLRRPELAALLDFERRRLTALQAGDDCAQPPWLLRVASAVEQVHGPHPEMPHVCADILAIKTALCNAERTASTGRQEVLRDRVRATVQGYLRYRFAASTTKSAGNCAVPTRRGRSAGSSRW